MLKNNQLEVDTYPACNRKSQIIVTFPRFCSFYQKKIISNPSNKFNADSIDVRHAEKFYTAGVMSSGFLAINSADYRHS